MKQVLIVETNAYTAFVSLDHEDKIALCYNGVEAIGATAETIKTIEDDSTWEEISYEQFMSEYNNGDYTVIAEAEMNI